MKRDRTHCFSTSAIQESFVSKSFLLIGCLPEWAREKTHAHSHLLFRLDFGNNVFHRRKTPWKPRPTYKITSRNFKPQMTKLLSAGFSHFSTCNQPRSRKNWEIFMLNGRTQFQLYPDVGIQIFQPPYRRSPKFCLKVMDFRKAIYHLFIEILLL